MEYNRATNAQKKAKFASLLVRLRLEAMRWQNLVLSRIDRLEQTMERQSLYGPSKFNQVKGRGSIPEAQPSWLAHLNPQTGCFEYYGRTSTFVIASSLGKRIRQLEEGIDPPPPQKRMRIGHIPVTDHGHDMESLGLNDLTGFCDYVMPSNATLRQHRCLRSDVADRHIESFFSTIHIFLPIFDVSKFRAKYNALRNLFGDNRLFVLSQGNHNRPQFLCLLYAVLALGALYEDERDDNSSWASWYFAEAQEILGRLLDAVNLELIQAAMLMGAYAQHAIKPSLAYNLTGIATRLAFSIGLNIESTYGSAAFDAEEARRTWWLIYVQEVELSLDSGRPMSICMSEMDIGYPTRQVNLSREPEIPPVFAGLSSVEALREELQQWHASLPVHLRFYYEIRGLDSTTKDAPCSWKARQHSSLRIHYNLAMIILFRSFLSKPPSDPSSHGSHQSGQQREALYKSLCLDAACDMISHIHELFTLAPSLRRWSYYCFYCLQATLVLLTKLTEDDNECRENQRRSSPPIQDLELRNQSESRRDLKSFCHLSIGIFEQIELKAANRCVQVVRKFLNRWEDRQRKYKQRVRPILNKQQALRSEHSTNCSQMADPDTHVPQLEKANSVGQPHFDVFQSWSSGVAASSNDADRRGSLNPPSENGMNVAEGDNYASTTPSTQSLGGLQAELELYCATYGNIYNGDSELDLFSNDPTAEFTIGTKAPTGCLLQVEQDLETDESGWFY
ncbi:uncharacterized protein Z518_10924 [Rhinocladiella mackenziei CBS 650.93]|uniref:Xylanolytic transcriptional activator regulatory domain-containing protein n=1 Tax=Rhinocladiella mackenziei CBS 650.93 TaxID=1442369 RepID=A0A0D2FD39_9EURO|nr:uncharacterized protein Z518_10924 [Rhinocladiella mackenziei CBS 650.93]KIW99996.1 hypothetical protein Z518_10924 [Rhinocladiella mackenziei CBS 650.93]